MSEEPSGTRSSLCHAQERCCVARAFGLSSITRKAVSDSLFGRLRQTCSAIWSNPASRDFAEQVWRSLPARPRAFLLPGLEVDNTPKATQGGLITRAA